MKTTSQFLLTVGLLTAGALAFSTPALAGPEAKKAGAAVAKNPVVVIKTSMGTVKAELYADKAPITVKNFLDYVDGKHYDGTIFHRVINNFMIQGGGFDKDMNEKKTRAPIKNEASNGLKNTVGTLAMARTPAPDSASAQFFINVKDNAFLDFRDPSPQGIGYAVFGKVIEGMDVVNKIKAVKTGNKGDMGDVPLAPVTIESIRRG
jgi:cyclophilin family peptidyl-prolyl cis-trans isomerase